MPLGLATIKSDDLKLAEPELSTEPDAGGFISTFVQIIQHVIQTLFSRATIHNPSTNLLSTRSKSMGAVCCADISLSGTDRCAAKKPRFKAVLSLHLAQDAKLRPKSPSCIVIEIAKNETSNKMTKHTKKICHPANIKSFIG